MVSPLALLRRLYVAGGAAALNDAGGIRLTGHKPPADLLDDLKANRDAVATELHTQGIGTGDDGLAGPRRYVTPPGCLSPRLCARLGPCSHFLMLQPCDATQTGGAGDD